MGYNDHVASLDAPLDRETGLSIGDGIADDGALAPELLLHNTEIEAWVRQWLSELTPRQRTVIERRYGLNGCDTATLEELAREIGITRERVRQIQAEALDKLRARLARRGLRSRRAAVALLRRPGYALVAHSRCVRSADDAGSARIARANRANAAAR